MCRISCAVLFVVMACVAAFAHAGNKAPASVRHVTGATCKNGLDNLPGDRFAVFVFCDDAMGTNIGIVHVGLGHPEPPWDMTVRFWQVEEWARDVQSYAWNPEGTLLLVGTSAIYGTGGLYLLDLAARKARAVEVSGEDTEVRSVNWKAGTAQVTVGEAAPKTVRLFAKP